MSLEPEQAEAPDTRSTQLEPNVEPDASGGGAPRTLNSEESLRDAVTTSLKEAEAAPAEPEDKLEDKSTDKSNDKSTNAADKSTKQEKSNEINALKSTDKSNDKSTEQPRENGKFVSAKPAVAGTESHADDAPRETSGDDIPQRNGDRIHNVPARFLPDSKELWSNVPRAVKRDIETMTRDHEAEIARHTEASSRYEQLRQYDDLARANGRDLRESLAKVSEIEDALQRNPLQGIQRLLIEAGPRKADGTPLSLMEVARHVAQMEPADYDRAMQGRGVGSGQAPQQRQPDPEITQLKQQLATMQQQQVTMAVIEPFKAANPRYAELEDDIAFFLQSDKIPRSLSMQDRLASAYDMAARINPPSHDSHANGSADLAPQRRVDDFDGRKSIKSAPGAVSPDMEPERGGSIRDLLEEEYRRHSRSR